MAAATAQPRGGYVPDGPYRLERVGAGAGGHRSMSRTVLVTGAAGFIGSHVSDLLLAQGDSVIGLDNLNDYYDPDRKRANLAEVRSGAASAEGAFTFIEGDIRDRELVARLFAEHQPDSVVHLAAMAGVGNSMHHPFLYYDVNLTGTLVLLEACAGRLPGQGEGRRLPGQFVLASTSSVYGDTQVMPFVETDPCERPMAPYASSKRAAELLGFTYHHLYGLSVNVLRFFTVYGPRGRPDMMAYKVADNIFFGRDVPLYNGGQMWRDWTYVGDIAKGVAAASRTPLGYEVMNLGRGEPVLLADFVKAIEDYLGRPANLHSAPPPETDIMSTHADASKAQRLLGYNPTVSFREGVAAFLDWYQTVKGLRV
jgi:UDP-glucuronate 4-epimerase